MAPAPLPLLGTFHEVSVAVDDVRAAVEFYEGLGFGQATTGDAYTHPYGVLTDGRVFIGLHERSAPSPVLSFVRPRVAQSLPAFADAGIELERAHTGDEVFNQLLFVQQCQDLLRNGAPGIHFYTLNKAHSTVQILRKLGLA